MGRKLIALLVFGATLAFVPSSWCGRDSERWYEGDLACQRSLARTVIRQIDEGLDASDFKTGDGLYSGEWLFGTYLMAGIGLCQIVLAHPETRAEFSPAVEVCIREILSERVRAFDAESWHDDPLASLDAGHGHAAYLGYFNLLLGLYRLVASGNTFAPLNDRISAALARRLAAAPKGVIETYPGERYPVDNAPVLASLALHERAVPGSVPALAEMVRRYRQVAVDPTTGLLIQALQENGRPADRARGSGSTLGAFFLGHGLPAFARELYASAKRELAVDVFGFGAMREYPRGQSGSGDIDSGPVIFGFGFSATGFAIGAAKMSGDARFFHQLWASTYLAGAPTDRKGDLEFLTAGPLGNAILLAMFTAREVGP
jgi:hypothetical protein